MHDSRQQPTEPKYGTIRYDVINKDIILPQYYIDFEIQNLEVSKFFNFLAKNLSYENLSYAISWVLNQYLDNNYRPLYKLEITEMIESDIIAIVLQHFPILHDKIAKINLDLLLKYYYISCKKIHEKNYIESKQINS